MPHRSRSRPRGAARSRLIVIRAYRISSCALCRPVCAHGVGAASCPADRARWWGAPASREAFRYRRRRLGPGHPAAPGTRRGEGPVDRDAGRVARRRRGARPPRPERAQLRGRSIVNTQPVPGTSRTSSVPPIAWTARRLIERPRPTPERSSLRCVNGRKSSSAQPGGSPPH